MIMTNVPRRDFFHESQLRYERFYTKRKARGKGLKSLEETYHETKARVTCYMATSSNKSMRKIVAG